ncbi:MAG: hypothetical protein VX834_01895 [Myxococcota bacterium]|nr:hypothetical protein [Myxococcota bacterium]
MYRYLVLALMYVTITACGKGEPRSSDRFVVFSTDFNGVAMARHHWVGTCNIWGLCSEVTEYRRDHTFQVVTSPTNPEPSYSGSPINWGGESRFSARIPGALDSLYYVSTDTHRYLVASSHEVLDRESSATSRNYKVYVFRLNTAGAAQDEPEVLFEGIVPHRVSCSEGSYSSSGRALNAIPSPSGDHIALLERYRVCNEPATVHLQVYDATTLQPVSDRLLVHEEAANQWFSDDWTAHWVSIVPSQQDDTAGAILTKSALVDDLRSLSRAAGSWPSVHQAWLDQLQLESTEGTVDYLVVNSASAYRMSVEGNLEVTQLAVDDEPGFRMERPTAGQWDFRYRLDASTDKYHIDTVSNWNSSTMTRLPWWSASNSDSNFATDSGITSVQPAFDQITLRWEAGGPDGVTEAVYLVEERDYASGTMIGRLSGMQTNDAGLWSSGPLTVGQDEIVPSADWHWRRVTMVRDEDGGLRVCQTNAASDVTVRDALMDDQDLSAGCLGARWLTLSPPAGPAPF